MFPYWILIAVWTLGAVQYSRAGSIAKAWTFYWLALIATAVMIGLRYRVGGDWGSYELMFDTTSLLTFGNAFGEGDPAYSLLNWLASQLGLGVVAVNVVCGLIVTWGLGRFAARQPNPWLTILVAVPYFIIVVSMGYTRQAAAIGIIMAALADLKHRSLLRMLGYVLVAAMFHKTAVLIVPIFAVAVLRRNIMAGVASALVFVGFYYAFLNSSADTLLTNYVAGDYDSQGAAIRVAMDALAAVLLLLFRKRMGFDAFESAIWLAFAAFAFACIPALLLVSASSGVDRIALFLIPLQLVVFSRLPYAFGKGAAPDKPVLGLVVLYCFAVQFAWLNFAFNANYWLPYRFAPTVSADDLIAAG